MMKAIITASTQELFKAGFFPEFKYKQNDIVEVVKYGSLQAIIKKDGSPTITINPKFIKLKKQIILSKADKFLNWAEISRELADSRSVVTKNRMPKKHEKKVNELRDKITEWLNNLNS